ncbi:hypothetical protein LguiA_036039 [Lonicera macranthoides]
MGGITGLPAKVDYPCPPIQSISRSESHLALTKLPSLLDRQVEKGATPGEEKGLTAILLRVVVERVRKEGFKTRVRRVTLLLLTLPQAIQSIKKYILQPLYRERKKRCNLFPSKYIPSKLRKGFLIRVPLIISGRLSSESAIAAFLFAKSVVRLGKKSGFLFTALYLKQCWWQQRSSSSKIPVDQVKSKVIVHSLTQNVEAPSRTSETSYSYPLFAPDVRASDAAEAVVGAAAGRSRTYEA